MRAKLLLAATVVLGGTVPAGSSSAVYLALCATPLVASAHYSPPSGSLEVPTVELDPIDLGQGSHVSGATALAPTVIPVWFHVITNGPGTDVLDLQLTKQIEVLNSAFAGEPGGAPSPFSFVHAGTDRTDSTAWYGFAAGSTQEHEAKAALRQGDAGTLNVYVNKTADGASWATFPWRYRFNAERDGVVMSRAMMPAGTALTQNEGDIAVHEVGHWLGLYHTFQGYDFTTKAGGGCAGEGDYVDDTPAEDVPAQTPCPILQDTCPAPGSDPVHNYMDYSSDICRDQFTQGQVDRMQEQWTTYRANGGKAGGGNS